MSNVVKKCGCMQCRRGLRCKRNSEMATKTTRKFRRETKEALRLGNEPPTKCSIPYTD
jgi:hypothetical protein